MAMPHSFVKDQARSDSITSESVSLSDMGDEFLNQHGRDHVSAMLAYAENEPSSEHSREHSRERAQDPIVGANRLLPFNLATCVRPNILALQPYRCARDDYKDDGSNILLDANENAYGPALDLDGNLDDGALQIDLLGLNRYPDPHQVELKQLLCNLRNTKVHTLKVLKPDNLFIGVGSDEVIDILFRCFCSPGHDKILTCPPTYGMYAVSAQVNDIDVTEVALDPSEGFSLRPDAINTALSSDQSIKLVYFCTPGNPTGNLISKSHIQQVLENRAWNGVVVLDEAYVDFATDGSSLAEWVNEWPNLIVMQTLSKGFGLAGIRLGVAFSSPEIAILLNNIKAPYNISSPTSALAIAALQPNNLAVMRSKRDQILEQKDRMLQDLPKVPGIGRILGGWDSNFLLVEVLSSPHGGQPSNETAMAVYIASAESKGIVVRFRGREFGCEGCLRITVGTAQEVDKVFEVIGKVLAGIFETIRTRPSESLTEQIAANDILA